MPNWQKVLIALILSLLLNALIVFGIGFVVLRTSDTDRKSLDKLKMLEVTVATPTPVPLAIAPVQPRPACSPDIDSDDLHTVDKAPKNPIFQSDKNLVAGSAQPATGNVPLPSQEGRNLKALGFINQKYTAGNGEESQAAPPVMEMAPAPAVQPKMRTETTPMPLRKSTPVPGSDAAARHAHSSTDGGAHPENRAKDRRGHPHSCNRG